MEWSTVSAASGVAVVALAGLMYLIRSEIKKAQADLSTLRPNGGSSMADKVDLILTRQSEVIDDLNYMRERLDAHIAWHLDKE